LPVGSSASNNSSWSIKGTNGGAAVHHQRKHRRLSIDAANGQPFQQLNIAPGSWPLPCRAWLVAVLVKRAEMVERKS
jgi:hypothetical protein